MPKHPKRRTRRNLAVLALSALCLAGFLYWDNTALQVTRFDPVFSDLPAGFDGCRIVVLSDLHGASFGAHNADLLAAVAAEQPEYIFFLGDLEDKYRGPEDGYADQKTPEELAAEVYAACGDPFWILLAHRNNRFARQYSLLGADLVCSGHAHGGIVRLPGTDGLFSHDLDLFPSYTAGLYEENGSVLFVTRGLGNSGPSFRVFNRPEIAVLTLRRAEG